MGWLKRIFGTQNEQPAGLDELRTSLALLTSRVSVVELELVDLQSRYKRLRAIQAADASRESREQAAVEPDASLGPPGGRNQGESKASLRKRALAALKANGKGRSMSLAIEEGDA